MNERPQIFGWLIAGALLGATAGMWLAEVRPTHEFTSNYYREARLKTAERRPHFAIGGAIVGAVLAGIYERSLSRQVTPVRVFAILVVIGVVALMFEAVRIWKVEQHIKSAQDKSFHGLSRVPDDAWNGRLIADRSGGRQS